MNRRLLTTLLVILQAAVSFAQLKATGEGPLFKEPDSGYGRLLHMKNGNTVFLQITAKDGLYVDIYDEQYKPKVQSHQDASFEKLVGSCVNAVFEVNGDIALFISEVEARQPILYRIIIDGRSGKIKRDDRLAQTLRYSYYDQPFIPTYAPVSSFFVRKDPASDNYAMVMLHTNDKSAQGNMEVIWYNGNHKEISRAYYQNPDDRYKYINYLDMAVIGEDRVCLFSYLYTQTSVGDRKGSLIMATLTKEIDTLAISKLNVGVKRVIDSGLVQLNPVTKKLLFLGYAHAEAGDEEKYPGIMGIIDPLRKEADQEIDIYPAKANEKKQALNGAAFIGAPQQLFVHSDGGFSIVYEELTRKQVTPLNAAAYLYCTMDWLSVGSFDANGRRLFESVIPMKVELRNYEISAFNADRVATGAQPLIKGEHYRSYACFQSKDKVYVTVNNTAGNLEKGAKGKPHEYRAVKEAEGFYYVCDGSSELPAFKPLFKQDKMQHAALIGVSAYDEVNDRWITLKMDKNPEHRGMRVVWLQP